jgi:hypothetical protein
MGKAPRIGVFTRYPLTAALRKGRRHARLAGKMNRAYIMEWPAGAVTPADQRSQRQEADPDFHSQGRPGLPKGERDADGYDPHGITHMASPP